MSLSLACAMASRRIEDELREKMVDVDLSIKGILTLPNSECFCHI